MPVLSVYKQVQDVHHNPLSDISEYTHFQESLWNNFLQVVNRQIFQVYHYDLTIANYLESIGEEEESREKPQKSREKIVALLSEDGKLSAMALAGKLGISAKSVEKHLANLKADGIIERIGPAKGGHWKVK